ncbi:MAG: hypothetical protein ACKN9W_09680 [Methylococcus sp.]
MPLPSDFLASLSCPHPREIIEGLKRDDRPKGAFAWSLKNEVTPSDLYCYFWARFGPPNGIQNFLRKNDSDNLIHWEWHLTNRNGWIAFQGMNFRTEIWLIGDFPFTNEDKSDLISQIKGDFVAHGKRMSEVRKSLENWVEFVNPYSRIRSSVETLLAELKTLELRPEHEAIPDLDSAVLLPEDRWGDIFARYSKGLGLCFGIRSMLPVMAEAFVNLILFMLMRPELKTDERLRENTIRQPIDVRVKSLHMTCSGFEHPVDYTHDACKAYHSLVNERNDLLHGNVVLEKLRFNEVFFNGRVPVFKKYRPLWERSVGVEIESVGLHRLEREVETVNAFIEYLKSCLKPQIREQIEKISRVRDLGLNTGNGRVGILFPGHLVDMCPVMHPSGGSDAYSAVHSDSIQK